MLQSTIFADLQVNNFGIPTVRFTPRLVQASWSKGYISALLKRLRSSGDAHRDLSELNAHLRRDIGLADCE